MYFLGIYFDTHGLLEALIQKKRKRVEIRALQDANVKRQYKTPKDEASFGDPECNVKRLYITDFRGKVVTGISAKDSLIRSIEVKGANHRHVEEVIAFQSEATSHFKPGEVVTIPILPLKGETEALLFTVPREALRDHLAEMRQLQIDPDVVGSIPDALCYFARWKFPDLTEGLIINAGAHEWTCAWMEKGRLKKAHSIPGGIESLMSQLLEDRKKFLLKKEIEGAAKQMDLLLLKKGLNSHLTGKLHEIKQELAKVRASFQKGKGESAVIFTGRMDAFVHLGEFLIDSYDHSRWPLALEEQKFAIPIGLALSQAEPTSLQLRREEFFPQKNWRKMGFYALALLSASILLSGGLFFTATHDIQSRKHEMVSSLEASARKRKLRLEGRTMEEKIDHWIAAVETTNKEYPYILQAPKAAEVLAWISSTPC